MNFTGLVANNSKWVLEWLIGNVEDVTLIFQKTVKQITYMKLQALQMCDHIFLSHKNFTYQIKLFSLTPSLRLLTLYYLNLILTSSPNIALFQSILLMEP